MAEITVRDAVQLLKDLRLHWKCEPHLADALKSTASLLTQQAAEIERLNGEIGKRDRMIERAGKALGREKDCDNCPVTPCIASSCAKSWKEWLEKEAEVKG